PVHSSLAAKADAGMKILTAQLWLGETEVGLEMLGLSQEQIDRALADRRRAEGRAILDRIAPTDAASAPQETAAELKAKSEALGAAIRSGVAPADAASPLGLSGICFTGASPFSLRLPESEAARLEDK